MQKKLFIKSFGCQMNEYDSAKIIDVLASSYKFIATTDPKEADLIVFNTCSIRDKAAEKVFSDLGRLKSIKKINPQLVLAVGGCVSVQEKTAIFKRAPYVDIVFGPQTLHRLPHLYARACKQESRIIDVTFPKIEKFDYLPTPSITGPVAYVSIIEGCDKFCSYCIVPYTRGAEFSRPIRDILDEVTILADKGAKEIHLLGQNVNAYRDANKNLALSTLIRKIAKIDAIERIRFTTSHPTEFNDELIMSFAEEPKLANHIHLPIQSGSDRILELMCRSYNLETYRNVIGKLRNIRPDISISTDFIVGFPSETDEDFAQTMETAKTINFDAAYSFIYSPRPNTPAANMLDNIDQAQKKQRLAKLQELLTAQFRQYNKKMVGTNQKVLVTAHAKNNPNQFYGRTENNRIVNFVAPPDVVGKIVEIKIIESLSNSLYGELLRS